MRIADYLDLMNTRPELFVNPPGAAFRILLREEEIARAEQVVGDRLMNAGSPREWARIGILVQDQYLMLLRDAVRFEDDSLGTYIRVVPPQPAQPGVAILAVFDGQVMLLRHFRHSTRDWHWEIPRGYGEANSTPIENARREIWEEVQGEIKNVQELGRVYPDTGLSSECAELVFAELERYGEGAEIEGIKRVELVGISEFEQRLREGVITDGFTIAAFAKARVLGLI